jgi:hypothetical protein
MNDTPRTDALYAVIDGKLPSIQFGEMFAHARTLERQNAELLAAFKKILNFTDLEMKDGDSARELSAAILIKLGKL